MLNFHDMTNLGSKLWLHLYVYIWQMLLYKVIHVAFKVHIFIGSEGMWLNEMKTKFVKEGRKLKWRAKRVCSCATC